VNVIAETSSNSAAWFTLAGALGGVIVAGLITLITAILTHRWQAKSREQEFSMQRFNELRNERRQIYVSYFAAETHLMQMADGIKKQVRSGDLPPVPGVPRQLDEFIKELASIAYVIYLIAGPDVRAAFGDRQEFVGAFIREAGTAEQTPDDLRRRRDRTYESLAEIMRVELQGNSGCQ